jgi:hypothetical protein
MSTQGKSWWDGRPEGEIPQSTWNQDFTGGLQWNQEFAADLGS